VIQNENASFPNILLLVSLSLVRLQATAALVQATDPRFGPNSLTIDTSTQLAWLDLTASAALSYNQVLVDTAPGGIFSGYRFATVPEVLQLYGSRVLTTSEFFDTAHYYPVSSPSIQTLFSLVGTSGTFYGLPGIPEE